MSLRQNISGSNLLRGAANPSFVHLSVLAMSTLAGDQNEARPGSGWQDQEVGEGRSCPVLVVREGDEREGRRKERCRGIVEESAPTRCWWGWKAATPL